VEPKIQVFFCLKTQYFRSQLQKTNAHEKEKKGNDRSSAIKQYDDPRRHAVANVESKTGHGEGTYLEQGKQHLQWG